MSRARTIGLEVIQFAPVLTLASTFVVSGEVDLQRASALFVVAAVEAVIVTGIVLAARGPLNTVLIGTNTWLLIGAVAFGVPIEPLADLLGEVQATALFACVLLVGAGLTGFAPLGFLGIDVRDRKRQLLGSLVLLALTSAFIGWSWIFVDNIRLGGGLPFILLNVSRRVLGRRLG
jgi:hypothetical protein